MFHRILRKIRLRIKALRNLVRNEVNAIQIKSSPALYIKALQRQGIDIQDDVVIFSPETLCIDLTRPSLISIGSKTFLHKNLTILTHDYATYNFLNKYGEFVPCSGRVTIGRNVWFGMNVTCLKGSDIGDNCIIGYGSVVMGKIPANSVAAGCPAKVICTLDEYFEKRKKVCVEEAFDYARSIKERYNRRPVPADFWEEFPLFVSGNEVDKYPEIPIKKQLGNSYNSWTKKHKAQFKSFEEFLKAAGL